GIDTGMGLERLTAVLQGVRSNYDADLFAAVLAGFRSRSADAPDSLQRALPGSRTRSAHAPARPQRGRAFKVLADHLRSTSMLIADGVSPGNEGRGYVLRRLVRRAAVHGRRVGLSGGLTAGVDDLVEVMHGAYPELDEHRG